MKKGFVIVCAVVMMLWAYQAQALSETAQWEEIGQGVRDIRDIAVVPEYPGTIVIASGQHVFKSSDNARSWQRIFSAGPEGVVYGLGFGGSYATLYAATDRGLYRSEDTGVHWLRVFTGKGEAESRCRVILADAGVIYLGTQGGLFLSHDNGRTWVRAEGELGKESIVDLYASIALFMATESAVYRSDDKGRSWEKIYQGVKQCEDDGEDVRDDEEPEEVCAGKIGDIAYDSGRLYVAVGDAVVVSVDGGKSWEKLSSAGLMGSDIATLAVRADSVILAGTDDGVFRYEEGIWGRYSAGLSDSEVQILRFGYSLELYAGCSNGLFRQVVSQADAALRNRSQKNPEQQPSISQIQRAAVQYAEVGNEKIALWRRQAAMRGWLPKLSIGVDADNGDLWHWEGGSTVQEGDDILRKGKGTVEWDVTLSWDLGDLVWNQDQTSIDVRSKLMVQLRDDILDQVTKLYFERLRVKHEIESLKAEGAVPFEKELRFRELTASLDALTGGYYSTGSIDTYSP